MAVVFFGWGRGKQGGEEGGGRGVGVTCLLSEVYGLLISLVNSFKTDLKVWIDSFLLMMISYYNKYKMSSVFLTWIEENEQCS